MAQKMKFDKDDPIYWHGDLAVNFYMLHTGQVKLYAQNGYPFITYREGDHFGESDCLLGESRDSKAVAVVASVVYMINKDDFNAVLANFPDQKKKFLSQAKIKRDKHHKKIQLIKKRHPLFDVQNINTAQSVTTVRKLEKMGIEINEFD